MAFEKISDNLHRLNLNIKAFAASSAEYYKLDLFDKIMKGATSLVKVLMWGFFLVFFILFISIAMAVWISEAIESPSSGFFIVGGFYLLLFLISKFFGGPVIDRLLLETSSKKVFKDPDHEKMQTKLDLDHEEI